MNDDGLPEKPTEEEILEVQERLAKAGTTTHGGHGGKFRDQPPPDMEPTFDAVLRRLQVGAEGDEQSRARAAAADAERMRSIGAAQWRTVCPTELQTTDWDDPRLMPYLRQIMRVRRWMFGKRGIYAVGRSGRGKSRAFWALVRRLMEEGRRVRVVKQNEVSRILNRDIRLFQEEINTLHGVEILAWDDWGKFDVIDAREDTLYAEIEGLIDARASNGKPMLITTNATEADILKRFGPFRGEPILRRIAENCEGVDFGW